MDLYGFFNRIHIVSHILSSNGGFLSHGSTPWHHPVVMNDHDVVLKPRAPDPGHGI